MSGPPDPITVFRVKMDNGQQVNCRFEGTMSGLLDQGDRVTVIGPLVGGVVQATRIVDEHGSEIGRSSSCFVATAAFGNPHAAEVVLLRRFRDRVLDRYGLGRALIRAYYRAGPHLGRRIAGRPALCRLVRTVMLGPLCAWIRRACRNCGEDPV